MDRLPSFDVVKLAVLVAGAAAICVVLARSRTKQALDATLSDPLLALPLAMALLCAAGALAAWPRGSLVGPVTAIACVAVARAAAQPGDAAGAVRLVARG